jgi:hypothetical protein
MSIMKNRKKIENICERGTFIMVRVVGKLNRIHHTIHDHDTIIVITCKNGR